MICSSIRLQMLSVRFPDPGCYASGAASSSVCTLRLTLSGSIANRQRDDKKSTAAGAEDCKVARAGSLMAAVPTVRLPYSTPCLGVRRNATDEVPTARRLMIGRRRGKAIRLQAAEVPCRVPRLATQTISLHLPDCFSSLPRTDIRYGIAPPCSA